MEYQYASNGKGNLGVTLGAIGTGLSVLNGGLNNLGWGMGNNGFAYGNGYGYGRGFDGGRFVTKDELDYSRIISAKDAEIALLKSEQNTEIKIADVYERLITRINADQKEQSAWNTQQMINNSHMSNAISVNANSIAGLRNTIDDLTKVVIPAHNICPRPMERYNSWTAPTAVTETPAPATT